MTGSFGFDSDLSGVWVVVERQPLYSGCRRGSEVDDQIDLLKADLDWVALEMKAEIARQDGQFLGKNKIPDE